MSATVLPEVSKKNPYWIPRERYYELKWFCMQYNSWKNMLPYISGLSRMENGLFISGYVGKTNYSDPVGTAALVRLYFQERIDMVEKAAKEAAPEFWKELLLAVTSNYSYEVLQARNQIPCGKELYYKRYRKFFWILNDMRK